uniref:non-specific serine/threonine protein kinase n=1 Tax=Kalanchoe fedtschenkoi TaxID=63787 RepID=A0A7N0VCP3_KALFE
MKKVLIHNKQELDTVKEEIRISSLFNHPNLHPLLDHAVIEVKGAKEVSWTHEAYLLFPIPAGATLLEKSKTMKGNGEFFSTSDVLNIFSQLCEGLKHMHSFDPPYAHNDVHPGNVIITRKKGLAPLARLMDFETARPARKQMNSPQEAQQLQEWASKHCSEQFRAPELWNCPNNANIDERIDIWSLGCTLFAIMYHTSPFEHVVEEVDGNLELAVINTQIKKWPPGPNPPYPEALHQFITWMLQPQATVRPRIDDIIPHIDKLMAKFGQ